MKSAGNRSALRFTALFKFFVVTRYSWARSESSITRVPRKKEIFRLMRAVGTSWFLVGLGIFKILRFQTGTSRYPNPITEWLYNQVRITDCKRRMLGPLRSKQSGQMRMGMMT